MEYERRFKFLICAPSFNTSDLDWLRLQAIVAEIERLGFSVVVARNTDDAELAIQTDAAIGCMVVDWGQARHPVQARRADPAGPQSAGWRCR